MSLEKLIVFAIEEQKTAPLNRAQQVAERRKSVNAGEPEANFDAFPRILVVRKDDSFRILDSVDDLRDEVQIVSTGFGVKQLKSLFFSKERVSICSASRYLHARPLEEKEIGIVRDALDKISGERFSKS